METRSTSETAAFELRLLLAFTLCLSALLLGVTAFGGAPIGGGDRFPPAAVSPAASKGETPQKEPPAQAVQSYHNDTSPPLRDLALLPVDPRFEAEREAATNPKIPNNHIDGADPVIQSRVGPWRDLPEPEAMPGPIRNFDGIPFPGVGCNCSPPDTNGEVGKTQYVQIVNEGYQVFNKSTGSSVLGPSSISSVWAGFGGACEVGGSGDPVVLYDQLADRWVITQFASASGSAPITDECVAVSTTSDATGTYNRYGFHLGSNFYDYPHLGVWPDGYYMSMNVFNAAGTAFLGPQPFVFDRAKMLVGGAATFISTAAPTGASESPYLPADLDGSTMPAAGAPNSFVSFPSGGVYKVWHFHADFATPANSTFTLYASPPAAAFTALCPSTSACIPQSGTTAKLDGLADRLMFRLAYRNFGDHEALVGNFSVSAGGVSGIRWFEMRNVTSGPVTVFQESTYQPDTDWRWMGSAAMDGQGNLAIGYSASSATIFPQIRYAGRFSSDPLNALTQGEAHLIDGTGSQTSTGNRWGDYSALTVDPVDDKTFWFTTEYYATTASVGWKTRIGSFSFSPVISIAGAGSSIVSAGPNGVLDPGETVTVALSLKNTGGPGTLCTSALNATLQATGGVTNPTPAAQNYGAVCSSSASITKNFTFTVSPALTCGGVVTASLALTDGVTNYGTVTFTFPTGVPVINFTEKFDSVVAPALPSGWAATNASGAALWTTSTTSPDTAPNDAFVDDPISVSDKRLDTPGIAINSANAQLSFRNNYNLEAGSSSFYDGGVLEVSSPNINAGTFTDITDAAVGGTFVSGGYVGTLSSSYSNPLAGRKAWSGNSGGYINTVINLGPNIAGQTIKLRFRMGSDNSTSSTGWRIDTLALTDGRSCAPIPQQAVSAKTHLGDPYNVPLPLAGALGVEPRRGSGANLNNHQVIVAFAAPITVGGATVTSSDGLATVSRSVVGGVVTLNLSAVADAQKLLITLTNVNDGTNTGDVAIPMGILLGDSNGDGFVNAGDSIQVRSRSGQPTDGTNFRSDFNTDGAVNVGDSITARSKSGNALP